ncbi:MAG: hypothetical protein DMD91_20665 [Candidatus Rokuibacteriota bacterium]|nr:MAG: hypothetical protein DMD91_20665 [Candidatus Rokubacteria bacterium]
MKHGLRTWSRRSIEGECVYRARYYHPGLQRFISEDPIGFAGGNVNVYVYVRNNPVLFRDPTGDLDPLTAALT